MMELLVTLHEPMHLYVTGDVSAHWEQSVTEGGVGWEAALDITRVLGRKYYGRITGAQCYHAGRELERYAPTGLSLGLKCHLSSR